MNSEILIEGQLVELSKRIYRFGRAESCEIRSIKPSVSRYACTLYQFENRWYLIDGNVEIPSSRNRNGIRLNGKLIDAANGCQLNEGDIVEFAPNSYLQFFANKQSEKTIDLQATFSDWRSG